MAAELCKGEKVRIIVYDQNYLEHVKGLLKNNNNNGNGNGNVEFFVWQTDDVWVRDNGPIFARDWNTGELVI